MKVKCLLGLHSWKINDFEEYEKTRIAVECLKCKREYQYKIKKGGKK